MFYLLTPEVRYVLQAYTHQMAACLAEDSGDGSPAMRRLQQLTDECWTLIVIIGLTHVSGVKDLQDCNMGEGVACPDAKQPEFYCAIMVGPHCIRQCICVLLFSISLCCMCHCCMLVKLQGLLNLYRLNWLLIQAILSVGTTVACLHDLCVVSGDAACRMQLQQYA